MCHACMSFGQHARIYKPGCVRCSSLYAIFNSTATRITVERPEGVVSDETVDRGKTSFNIARAKDWGDIISD